MTSDFPDGSPPDPGALLRAGVARARQAGPLARGVVLVEGLSDYNAVVTLARRCGRDLDAEGVEVIAIAGATNAARFVDMLGPHGYGTRLAGLYDLAEETIFARALRSGGYDPPLDRTGLEACGFFVCVEDLEDEMIRSLGSDVVLGVIEAHGELHLFRRFQGQIAQRERSLEAQLHRFLGIKSGRKIRYGGYLAGALDLARMPRPLEGLLAFL